MVLALTSPYIFLVLTGSTAAMGSTATTGSRTGQTSQRFGPKTGPAGNFALARTVYSSPNFHIILNFTMRLLHFVRFKAWDKPDFRRSAQDIAFAVAMFFQKRGSLQNYYMVRTALS